MTTTADTRSNAERYADDIAQMIRDWQDSGTPFGLNEDYDPETDYLGDKWRNVYDYLQDALDFEIRTDLKGDYRSAKILIAYGGPNAWIDTATQQLIVAWWSEAEYRDLPGRFCEELDAAIEEMRAC